MIGWSGCRIALAAPEMLADWICHLDALVFVRYLVAAPARLPSQSVDSSGSPSLPPTRR